MIKANELRLGNYFQDQLTGRILIVDSLSNDRIIFDQQGGALPRGWQARPIPITKEWLQRFGFEMRMINGIVPEWYIMCTPPNYKREFALIFRFGMLRSTPPGVCDENRWHAWMDSGDSHNFNIQSIHQLQNVFFAITGKELKVKEPI